MNGAKKKVKQAANNDGTEIPCGQCSLVIQAKDLIVSHLWYCNQCTQQKCLCIQSSPAFDDSNNSVLWPIWRHPQIHVVQMLDDTGNKTREYGKFGRRLVGIQRSCMYVYITFPKVPFQVYIAAVVSSWVLLRAGTWHTLQMNKRERKKSVLEGECLLFSMLLENMFVLVACMHVERWKRKKRRRRRQNSHWMSSQRLSYYYTHKNKWNKLKKKQCYNLLTEFCTPNISKKPR